MDAFNRAIGQLFARLGSPAQYQVGAGERFAILVMRKAPDVMADFGQTHLAVSTYRFDIQVADVTKPSDGDHLFLGGTIYAITGEPLIDRDHLVWTVSAYLRSTGSLAHDC